MEGSLGEHQSGGMSRETADAKAECILFEELHRIGWNKTDLAARPKSDPVKLSLVARLRKETRLTLKERARRVHVGTSKSANARLHGWMRKATDVKQGQLPF